MCRAEVGVPCIGRCESGGGPGCVGWRWVFPALVDVRVVVGQGV